jgi:hypothetical protein
MAVDFVAEWQSCHDSAVSMINAEDPMFLARIGGSDTDAVIEYVASGSPDGTLALPASLMQHLPIVQRYNGYYDKSDDIEKYIRYCTTLLKCYTDCSDLVMCGSKLLSTYFPNMLDASFIRDLPLKDSMDSIIDSIEGVRGSVRFYPYNFIERIVLGTDTLFRAFEKTLTGKKVLVVSPFSQSIESNFHNRNGFFRNYIYPEFELKILKTPITYAGLPEEYYPHDDWFQTTEYLKEQLASIDFDLALLSCGSYAMPLGLHIRDVLKKKAIYVGGVLQLYFGIMGRRYENIFFTNQIDIEKFIYPVESSDYMQHVTVPSESAKEAFGAYF